MDGLKTLTCGASVICVLKSSQFVNHVSEVAPKRLFTLVDSTQVIITQKKKLILLLNPALLSQRNSCLVLSALPLNVGGNQGGHSWRTGVFDL